MNDYSFVEIVVVINKKYVHLRCFIVHYVFCFVHGFKTVKINKEIICLSTHNGFVYQIQLDQFIL